MDLPRTARQAWAATRASATRASWEALPKLAADLG